MKKTLQAIRGMNDLLPDKSRRWQRVENTIAEVLTSYGFEQVRIPILEQTELFARTIGEVTDIVEKEMYTFPDRNGDSLSLRPEGTAGVVRAGIEHGLFHNQTQRLWYQGPMFRHERPQRGRFRQFHQIGAEIFGYPGPEIDAELIAMTARIWKKLGLDLDLQINSLGSSASRQAYRNILVQYFQDHLHALDEDSQRRLSTNPLRILDSKNPALGSLIANAPRLSENLDPESEHHFQALCQSLDMLGVEYRVNPSLVRGLDYYNRTVFEWVTNALGAQGTVCAGGRYDGLVQQLGGKPTPAIGFALGLERLLDLVEQNDGNAEAEPIDLYFVAMDADCRRASLVLAEQTHDGNNRLKIAIDHQGGSAGKQVRRADKVGAKIVAIIGPDELEKNQVSVKFMGRQEQIQVSNADFLAKLHPWIVESNYWQ